jgi:hypothetical protein
MCPLLARLSDEASVVTQWSRFAVLSIGALLSSFGQVPVAACEYDGIPGYNHATGQIDADPYAGAYTEVAEKVARDQRAAAIERARTAFVVRFGLTESAEAGTAGEPVAVATAPVLVAVSAPDARPN